jgi:glyceraldehyde 3-phosphate dehydrogenase
MTAKVTAAIIGFGRIGRLTLRSAIEAGRSDIAYKAIVEPGSSSDECANAFKYDSVHGTFKGEVKVGDNWIDVGTGKIRVYTSGEPSDWDFSDIDVAMVCAGSRFNNRAYAEQLRARGAKKVLFSAPSKEADRTVVYGVNHRLIQATDTRISNGSCTTNALAPIVSVLDECYGIKSAIMETVHAFTGDQPTADRVGGDGRARAASVSIVPTTTGAASAIKEVINLDAFIDGEALRVPVADVSALSLFATLKVPPQDVDTLNQAFFDAHQGKFAHILGWSDNDYCVSCDFIGDGHSSIFLPKRTMLTPDGLCRIVAWYDNEWAFSRRMSDTAVAMMAAAA